MMRSVTVLAIGGFLGIAGCARAEAKGGTATAIAVVPPPPAHDSSISIVPKLAEYVHFITYDSTPDLPDDPPDWWMLAKDRMAGRHVPEGNVAVDFAISGSGNTSIVTSAYAELLSASQVPSSARPGGVLPMLKPFQETILVRRGVPKYPLFRGQALAYRDGEIDALRLNVLVADGEDPGIFTLRLHLEYQDTVTRQRRIVESEKFYVGKFAPGRTSRNPYMAQEGEGRDRDAIKASEDQVFNLLNNQDRPDFYTIEPVTDADIASFNADGKCTSADIASRPSRLTRALLGETPRSVVQRFGFASNGPRFEKRKLLPESALPLDLDAGRGEGFTWEGSYRVRIDKDIVIYEGLEDDAFHCLEIDTLMRASHDRDVVAQDLVARLGETGKDVAWRFDLVTLLALVPSKAAYDRILAALDDRSPVVRRHAALAFARTRYVGAHDALRRLSLKPGEFARYAAMRALAMSGTEADAVAIVQGIAQGSVPATNLEPIAEVVRGVCSAGTAARVLSQPDAAVAHLRALVLAASQ